MYKDYFGFIELPFSIVPSARYLYLSSRHREAMGHLQAGLGDGGGFAMLTGEVGTGKTTVSKAMLSSLNDNVKAGLILNPTFSESDLLEAICDEFEIEYPQQASLKQLTKAIYQYLMDNHSKGVQTLLLIDEAQHLSAQVLEQLRLLTNLETDSQKLLKVLLVGQPELQMKLQTPELRQLAQRITGRYHLLPLTENEVKEYIDFRLQIAGSPAAYFSAKAVKVISRYTQGVPRLINLVCDKALLYAYYSGEKQVSSTQAEKACQDVMSFQAPATQAVVKPSPSKGKPYALTLLVSLAVSGAIYLGSDTISQFSRSFMPPMPKAVAVSGKQNVENDLVLTEFLQQSSSRLDAMQALYSLWGVKASVVNADCLSDSRPFQCEQGVSDYNSVLKEGRPVVLELAGEDKPAYAVLYSGNENHAELINKQSRIRVPAEWLKEVWNGRYQTLWYSEINSTLKSNSRGHQVKVLDELLAKALSEEPTLTTLFDETLETRVKAFQAWQGLDADGVVGRKTLQVLDRLTNDSAPKLLMAKTEEVK